VSDRAGRAAARADATVEPAARGARRDRGARRPGAIMLAALHAIDAELISKMT
jgi:hypothetical protein